MLRTGETLTSRRTGATLVFRRTAADTHGGAVVAEVFLEPNGYMPRLHVHPAQTQRFEVLAGELGTQVGPRRAVLRPSARLTVPAGAAHRVWNAGDEVAHLVVDTAPALRFESLVETLLALADDPGANPLRLAVVAHEHFDTIRLPSPPAPVQRLALALAAPLGRALGYRPVLSAAGPGPTAGRP